MFDICTLTNPENHMTTTVVEQMVKLKPSPNSVIRISICPLGESIAWQLINGELEILNTGVESTPELAFFEARQALYRHFHQNNITDISEEKAKYSKLMIRRKSHQKLPTLTKRCSL